MLIFRAKVIVCMCFNSTTTGSQQSSPAHHDSTSHPKETTNAFSRLRRSASKTFRKIVRRSYRKSSSNSTEGMKVIDGQQNGATCVHQSTTQGSSPILQAGHTPKKLESTQLKTRGTEQNGNTRGTEQKGNSRGSEKTGNTRGSDEKESTRWSEQDGCIALPAADGGEKGKSRKRSQSIIIPLTAKRIRSAIMGKW